jgi:hypothetical protein
VENPDMKYRFSVALIGLAALLAACAAPTPPPTVLSTLTPPASATLAVTPDRALTGQWATVAALATALPDSLTAAAAATATPRASRTPRPSPAATLSGSATPAVSATLPPRATPLPTQAPSRSPTALTPTATPSARLLAFSAAPDLIDPGQSVALSWEVIGSRAEICALEPHGVVQPGGCLTLPLSGTVTLATAPRVRYWARFSLRAYDDDPATFDPYAEVAVPVRCPDAWFTGAPPGGLGDWNCPAGPARATAGAAERFEFGGMYWLAEPDEILVYWDGHQAHVRDLPQDQPEADPSLEPPPGFYQPVRGFGLVWRGLTDLGLMRPVLGWAVEPEHPYTFTYQCNAAPDLRQETCFVLGPHGLTSWFALGWGETLWP